MSLFTKALQFNGKCLNNDTKYLYYPTLPEPNYVLKNRMKRLAIYVVLHYRPTDDCLRSAASEKEIHVNFGYMFPFINRECILKLF